MLPLICLIPWNIQIWNKIYVLQYLSCKLMKVDEICMVDVSLGLVYSHLSSWSSIFILLKYRKKTHLHNSVERTVVINCISFLCDFLFIKIYNRDLKALKVTEWMCEIYPANYGNWFSH